MFKPGISLKPERYTHFRDVWVIVFTSEAGDCIQMAQSSVGKNRPARAAKPPRNGVFSIKCTSNPKSVKSIAACMPAMPPPIIKADLSAGNSSFSRGSRSLARSMAAWSMALAFSVASDGVSRWGQAQWSLMSMTSTKYGLSPTSSTA